MILFFVSHTVVKLFLIFFVFSYCWGQSKRSSGWLLSDEERLQQRRCYEMFRKSPSFNRWYEANLEEIEALRQLE
ncbi:MAG: hypothetical protein OXN83_02030, partial [Oligoflexia bacterium]|nr:hypothetical protein [Oligoflexia bacterium]